MRIAVAKYTVAEPRDFAAFADRQRRLLEDAAGRGAWLAVLPEYLALELGATFDDAVRCDLHASLAAIQAYRDDWIALYARLARDTGMRIVAGTFLVASGDGRTRPRLRMAGDRSPLDLTVTRTAGGRLGRIHLQPPRGETCVP